MALHPTCHAVENYLTTWFPGGVIKEFEWVAQRCWAFKVSVPSLHFQLLVSTEFLDKTRDDEIERLLHDWHVASLMRLEGARDWVYVSLDGASLGIPESHRGSRTSRGSLSARTSFNEGCRGPSANLSR